MKFGNPGERLRKKRWNLDELPKFEKNFYTEPPEVQRMSQVIFYSLSTHTHTHRSRHYLNVIRPYNNNDIILSLY